MANTMETDDDDDVMLKKDVHRRFEFCLKIGSFTMQWWCQDNANDQRKMHGEIAKKYDAFAIDIKLYSTNIHAERLEWTWWWLVSILSYHFF